LKITPAPVPIIRRAGPPHSGHFFRGSAVIAWNLSKRLPVRSHSYSYVGRVFS
jgi:hypothetical protein